jgi:twitching motility protein PilT
MRDSEFSSMTLPSLIAKAHAMGASDLHLEAGTPVVVRVREELLTIGESIAEPLLDGMASELIGNDHYDRMTRQGSVDHSTTIAGTRCRVNIYRTVRGLAMAVRLLSSSTQDLRGSNLHPDLRKLIDAKAGLAIVSGPTGSGKSTTLAALIEEINGSRARHIITLESPLEYMFENRRSFIRQREIPTHSPSYEQAIIDALRENPDVLVIGEMRTPEVMRLTLSAAETGHLVLATMHSATCAEAVARLCMSFPAELQGSIRAQLADCLVGIVCQRLEYLESAGFRVPRCEILLGSSAARGAIRGGQFSQLPTVIQAGGEDGMWTFDRYDRWLAQKTDWVRPQAARTATEQPRTQSAQPTQASAPKQPTQAAPAREDDVIEIEIDESLDLNEIAKRI